MMLIVTVCGIPGSGKSIFCQYLQSEFHLRKIRTQIISYDAIGDQFERDSDSFHRIRQEGVALLESILTEHTSSTVAASGHGRTNSVAIVDDVMHLRSMRRAMYKLARTHRAPSMVVHVKTDLSVALSRNARRSGIARVPDDVIEKLHDQFDAPSVKAISDRCYVVVDGNSTESMRRGVARVIEEAARLSDSHAACLACLEDTQPLVLAGAVADALQTSRPGDAAALDMAIRKVIANTVRNYNAQTAGHTAVRAGRLLSDAKARTLSRFRVQRCHDRSDTSQRGESLWLEVFAEEVFAAVGGLSLPPGDEGAADALCDGLSSAVAVAVGNAAASSADDFAQSKMTDPHL